ncbi:MAG: ankyrin repeat domain-containing protein [Oscillospiraceae bacterium]|jgi:hypothetical protein|nr:ankyrin repeat domain-containing protein [Oscillospiraceae bacterium]
MRKIFCAVIAVLAVTLALSSCKSAPEFASAEDERLFRGIEGGAELETLTQSVRDGASVDSMRYGRVVRVNMVEFAVKNGRDDAARWLIENGANVSYKTTILGQTLLMFMAQSGKAELCELLLARGADAAEGDRLGSTALEYAFKAGAERSETDVLAVYDLLTAHGASPTRQTLAAALNGYSGKGDGDGRYALLRRVTQALRDVGLETGLSPTVDSALLGDELSAEALTAVTDRRERERVLLCAAAFGSVETVSRAADCGYDLHATDGAGNTALLLAARYGNTPVAIWLIEHGAKLGAQNSRGETALSAAAAAGNDRLVRALEERGAVSAMSQSGCGCACAQTCG